MKSGTAQSTRLPVQIVAGSSRATGIQTGNTAPVSVSPAPDGKAALLMDDGFMERIAAYRTSMSLAKSMLAGGIITAKDYDKIDRIIANKYGLSLGSICCRKPLIAPADRGNMRHNEGSDTDGPDDY